MLSSIIECRPYLARLKRKFLGMSSASIARSTDGGVSFLVHHDVEGISPHERNSSVAKYRLRLSSFREITREARTSEHTGCRPRQQFSVGGARPDAPLAPQCIHPTSCAHLPPAQAAWLREVEEEAAGGQ